MTAPSRRDVLLGGAIASLTATTGWAKVGQPIAVSAAKTASGTYVIAGIKQDGSIGFDCPLPARGHASVAHPDRPEVVAFARRPGDFAYVLDCISGQVLATLQSPSGSHFYGHGAFSPDGKTLFTTENNFIEGSGRIGVWNADRRFKRLGSFSSGGTGPHEIKWVAARNELVIANGGIEPHPDSGRTKLNLPTMRPNLSYFTADGAFTETLSLRDALHKNSLRHVAVGADGTVAVGAQWQGTVHDAPSLLICHKRGDPLQTTDFPKGLSRDMEGYVGSIAMRPDGDIVITSPRGGITALFDKNGRHLLSHAVPDVCGVAQTDGSLLLSTGTGALYALSGPKLTKLAQHNLAFDNHLTAI